MKKKKPTDNPPAVRDLSLLSAQQPQKSALQTFDYFVDAHSDETIILHINAPQGLPLNIAIDQISLSGGELKMPEKTAKKIEIGASNMLPFHSLDCTLLIEVDNTLPIDLSKVKIELKITGGLPQPAGVASFFLQLTGGGCELDHHKEFDLVAVSFVFDFYIWSPPSIVPVSI